MAIGFDAATVGAFNDTPVTHTTTGADRFLFVFVGGSDRPSAVTYNGVAMTLLDTLDAGSNRSIELWGLIAPSTGAHGVAFTGGASFESMAMSYTGARQDLMPFAIHKTGVTAAVNHSDAVTTIAENSWIIAVANESGSNSSAGANTTLRGASATFAFEGYDSNGPKSPPGSHTLNFTGPGGTLNWTSMIVALEPVPTATGMMGVL